LDRRDAINLLSLDSLAQLSAGALTPLALNLARRACIGGRPLIDFGFLLSPMTDPDLKTTLREFKEYVDLSYESPREIATRIGVSQPRIWDWLARKSQPKAKSLAKLRRFLDNEAKRPAQGDGIRPIEPVPYKIIRPLQQVRYARICPFCRKARGKIRKARRYFVSGWLYEVWGDRTDARGTPGSLTSLEW
jgi:transcriptional regulator with XRE-family HTH domain